MSNPPLAPENAAAASSAAVSPVRTTAGAVDTRDDTAHVLLPLPEAAAPSSSEQTPPPSCPPAATTTTTTATLATPEQGPVSSVPPPPPPPSAPSALPASSAQTPPAASAAAPAAVAGEQGTPGTDSLAAQATGTSAAPLADPVKYARGPAVLQRPHGPSLLTQALATARGIPRQTQPDPPHSHNNPNPSHLPDLAEPSTRDAAQARDPRHGSLPPADGDSLTPRLSPRKTNMSSSTMATTMASPVYGRLDLGEVNSMLSGHREFLSKTKSRTGSFETTERERPSRWSTYSNDKAGTNPLTSPRPTDSHVVLHDAAVDDDTGVADSRPSLRSWKTDHRVSMGPEKAWSIGAGDSVDGQDGQVEKSISEVLAGVEHNARSRKASHSLRFFKEGLPEEKGKRKDQRSGMSTREKSPAGVETLADIQEKPVVVEAEVVDDGLSTTEHHDWVRPIPTRTPEVKIIQGSPENYFAPKPDENVPGVGAEPTASEHKREESKKQEESEPTDPSCQLKPRRVSDLSIGAGDSTEDGEESGEEKISSAVFLPHQSLEEETQEHPPATGAAQRAVPSRRHSRSDDFHPWLVKADEPEVDRKRESIDLENEIRAEAAEYPSVAPEVASRQVDESAPLDQREPAVLSSRLSRPVSQHHEDAVHDHQWTPKQPLDAIELIPYKHQVGGHTTMWRFSRRAVCKQLNNRENEFYEKIEKYHRDLLAFLPRYIGVLNVTFQKQPRRKSTMKRDDAAVPERAPALPNGSSESQKKIGNGESARQPSESQASCAPRVISQSIQASSSQVPTVTFADNQHILPRSFLQPSGTPPGFLGRFRSASGSAQGVVTCGPNEQTREDASRPSLQDRHANSWGATTVNKRLRNEVFNDAFLKQPIAIHRHRKGHQRVGRMTALQQVLRSGSDPSLVESPEKRSQSAGPTGEPPSKPNGSHAHSQSDFGQAPEFYEDGEATPKDVTGTSAPEPQIFGDSSPGQKKKRRYSGTGLRRKPKDVRDSRGDLQYFEDADGATYKGDREESAGYKGDTEEPAPMEVFSASPEREPAPELLPAEQQEDQQLSLVEFEKIPRPVNPKEAQTLPQRDSRVEYFLLLEDLTAGMKRPCIMDLKMGTRQYGVDANAKKQKSQQGKCAKTTSRELGVRVCGLQVWDRKTQGYIFKDKYYGRSLKKGAEFQSALTRFLYDGVDRASILRHVPTVLQKLDELEVIIKRLRGYRFYAASLLMFYDGDDSTDNNNSNTNHYVDDSTTDFATDTEEAPLRRARRSPREIDFKMADFANCVTAGDLSARDRPCPPRHPDEPDRGFLRGLRSLRGYFLRIQRDTRVQMGLACVAPGRRSYEEGDEFEFGFGGEEEDEGSVSE